MAFGLHMITLPSHTSHTLQPLDVSCFKPFKTTFKKEKNATMAIIKYQELNTITLLVRWIKPWTNPWHHKTLGLLSGLLEHGHLIVDQWIQISPSTIYTTTITTLGNEKGEGEEVTGEKDYILGDQVDQDEQE